RQSIANRRERPGIAGIAFVDETAHAAALEMRSEAREERALPAVRTPLVPAAADGRHRRSGLDRSRQTLLLHANARPLALLGAQRTEEVGHDAVHQLEVRRQRGRFLLRVVEHFLPASLRVDRRARAAVDEDELRLQHEALAFHVDALRDDAAAAKAIVD